MRAIRGFVAVAAVALAACGGGGSSAAASATITGRVSIGPFCPVERLGSPCPTPPVSAEVTATRRGDKDPAATARAASDGSFRLAVPPGDYVVTARARNALFCRSENVTAAAGRSATVTIDCDTGIR
jgi:hypothetical protein